MHVWGVQKCVFLVCVKSAFLIHVTLTPWRPCVLSSHNTVGFSPHMAGKCLWQQRLTLKQGGGPNVRGWNYPGGPPPPHLHCLLPAHPSRPGKSGSVEHDGLGILVCHLSHVTKDIFFCDNTKKPPVERDRADKVKRKKPTCGSTELWERK